MHKHPNKITESEAGDLKRLVDPLLTIDEYKSKMGEDRDVIVLGISTLGKHPAEDIMDFTEKSYDWVLDADASSGETSDGNFLVFVELERNPSAAEKIISFITDLLNLTEQKIGDWKFTYFKSKKRYPLTIENIKATVILSPAKYDEKITNKEISENAALNQYRAISGLPIPEKMVTDKALLNIQRAAGIK